jgi:hypothetical protein
MADDMKALPEVYKAIAAVMEDVGREGIAKDRKNQQQGYSFRGIDDVYNALAPILARHHLIIVPRVLSREKTERDTQKGGVLFYVVVHVEFDIICSVDGSRITAATYGEAMDSADKATNKAMSAAYKYMAMQTFCIPTEGDNDADAHHHEVRRDAAPSPSPVRSQQATGADARPPASAPVQTMSKGAARGDYGVMVEEMRRLTSTRDLKEWGRMNAERVKLQPKDWQAEIRKSYRELMEGLQYAEQASAEAEQELEDAR